MADLVNVAPGQCRLQMDSSSQISLQRFGGAYLPLKIGSAWEAKLIPSSGPTLANTGLTAATLYYIYAYDSSGTLTLEASATAHAADSDTGVRIKSGDATRTLVGMAYMGAGSPGTFVDSATQRFLLNWFQRRAVGLVNGFTTARTTTSGSYVEVNTEIRCEFLTWSDEAVYAGISGSGKHSSTGFVTTAIGFDGTTADDAMTTAQAFTPNATMPYAVSIQKSGLSEGYHYATLLGKTDNPQTATWFGGSVGAGGAAATGRTSLTAMVRG